MMQASKEPILKMIGINKSFGGVDALNNVDLYLYPGEVLALLGNNGAGKSTLVKIVSGVYPADSGEIYYKNEKVNIRSTSDARKLGIETIYQDLALVNCLNFYQNIFLGRELCVNGIGRLLGIISKKEMKKQGTNLIRKFGIDLSHSKQLVNTLSGGQRQSVALTRAIHFKAEVIIMDEPTAALGVAETQKVYEFINQLKEHGTSIIMISHNINEVFNVADRFMVLRTGSLVGVKSKCETNADDLSRMIITGVY
jgi:ABC-type sugar transport system ATPase subunit